MEPQDNIVKLSNYWGEGIDFKKLKSKSSQSYLFSTIFLFLSLTIKLMSMKNRSLKMDSTLFANNCTVSPDSMYLHYLQWISWGKTFQNIGHNKLGNFLTKCQIYVMLLHTGSPFDTHVYQRLWPWYWCFHLVTLSLLYCNSCYSWSPCNHFHHIHPSSPSPTKMIIRLRNVLVWFILAWLVALRSYTLPLSLGRWAEFQPSVAFLAC